MGFQVSEPLGVFWTKYCVLTLIKYKESTVFGL